MLGSARTGRCSSAFSKLDQCCWRLCCRRSAVECRVVVAVGLSHRHLWAQEALMVSSPRAGSVALEVCVAFVSSLVGPRLGHVRAGACRHSGSRVRSAVLGVGRRRRDQSRAGYRSAALGLGRRQRDRAREGCRAVPTLRIRRAGAVRRAVSPRCGPWVLLHHRWGCCGRRSNRGGRLGSVCAAVGDASGWARSARSAVAGALSRFAVASAPWSADAAGDACWD